MAHAEEIARLERELAALRSQYVNLARNGRVAKRSVVFLLAALAVLLGYLLWKDFVMGAFALIMAAAFAALVWLTRPRTFRWIDVGTPTGEFHVGPSQAQKVEQWIADRESRLSELRSAVSSADSS
jgi:glutathione S-transferase